MEPAAAASPAAEPASLIVTDPGGHRTRVPIAPLPFLIGRQPQSNLILRDSRVSRTHARIVFEHGGYVLEDTGSRHGIFVNGQRIERQPLANSDRIDFGAQDSYQLLFMMDGAELRRLMEQVAAPEATPGAPGLGGGLARLRAVLDLARTLQGSFSLEDVLVQVVDTALAVTGSERGFLLLKSDDGLETRVARHRRGHKLPLDELRVPRTVIHRALQHRRELLFMNFDASAAGGHTAEHTVADLDLRSVVCVPLVRIRAGQGDTTSLLTTGAETVGVLYLDSRLAAADMAGGNRELLQTLAMEASTVLENARLLEEERAKQRMEEELKVARDIQQSLLPRSLPSAGWLRAAGSSVASAQVGGDYYDVIAVNDRCWGAVVADVSGKGVSSALLAALLQGALIPASDHADVLTRRMERLNTFLIDRTGGEKYATVFYCLLDQSGRLDYVNAAHCPPIVVRPSGETAELGATGVPVGLLEGSKYELAGRQLSPGEKVVIYTDGVTEAQDARGAFFGRKRLFDLVRAQASASSSELHDAIQGAVREFTEGAPQSDDITLVVLDYRG
ncbi:MAG: SpoIIE family protein phosphatase [Bryobacteraceae bacterium]|jgi:serine phosphatase RsbU (regulator of sigma subunit)